MNKLFKIIRTESIAFLISAFYQSIISGITIYFNIKDMKFLFFLFLFIAIISFIGLIIIWVNKVFDFRNKEIKSLQNDINDLAIAINVTFRIKMLMYYRQDHIYSQFNVNELVLRQLDEERQIILNELSNNEMKEKSRMEIDKILNKIYEPNRDNKSVS
jgi:hypothetical protein